MARMRGGGKATFSVRTNDGTEGTLGEAVAGPDFGEAIAGTPAAAGAYEWTGDRARPVAVLLQGDTNGALEVDCVVPFVSR
jgi:hypothetical protein